MYSYDVNYESNCFPFPSKYTVSDYSIPAHNKRHYEPCTILYTGQMRVATDFLFYVLKRDPRQPKTYPRKKSDRLYPDYKVWSGTRYGHWLTPNPPRNSASAHCLQFHHRPLFSTVLIMSCSYLYTPLYVLIAFFFFFLYNILKSC